MSERLTRFGAVRCGESHYIRRNAPTRSAQWEHLASQERAQAQAARAQQFAEQCQAFWDEKPQQAETAAAAGTMDASQPANTKAGAPDTEARILAAIDAYGAARAEAPAPAGAKKASPSLAETRAKFNAMAAAYYSSHGQDVTKEAERFKAR